MVKTRNHQLFFWVISLAIFDENPSAILESPSTITSWLDFLGSDLAARTLRLANPPPEFQPTHDGNKIGLRNARERLQLAFGNNAKLNLDIAEQVTSTVEIPL